MPKKSYAFEPGADKRLMLSWKGAWKDFTVTLDGNAIGSIPDQKALLAGQDFLTPDGSTITVQLVKKFAAAGLHVSRNGEPLPGSAADPVTRLKGASGIVFFVGGLNIGLGLLSFILDSAFLARMGIGWGSILFGLVFLVLGFFVRRRSSIALILAMIVLALDGILGLALGASQGGNPPVGGIIARVFLMIGMFQGIGAIKVLKLKREEAFQLAGEAGAVAAPSPE